MYIKDLLPYIYLNCEPRLDMIAVGWLDERHKFQKGHVPEPTLNRILALCFEPVNQTRGIHPSPFLPYNPLGYTVEYQG